MKPQDLVPTSFGSAALAAPLALGAPAFAQEWIRDDGGAKEELRFLNRDDGVLVCLSKDDHDEIARIRTFSHEGEFLTGFKFETLFEGIAEPFDMALLPNGDVVVVGRYVADNGYSFRPWLGVIDPMTGEATGHARFSWNQHAFDRVFVADDGIFVLGVDESSFWYSVLKFDFSGNLLFAQQAGLLNLYEDLRDACLTPSGGLAVLFHNTIGEPHVITYDADGNQLWHKYYDPFEIDDIGVTSSGELWLAGEVNGDQVAVIALSPSTGDHLWAKEYLGYGARVWAILPKSNGGALLSVERTVSGGKRGSALSIDATGGVEWNRMYDISNGYAWQGIAGAIDVGARGFVLRPTSNGNNHLLAVGPDGSSSLPCVSMTNLATLAQTITARPDEPPASQVVPMTITYDPWLLQPVPMVRPANLECGNPCSVTMAQFGAGLAGSGFIQPELSGVRGACAGTPHPELRLTKGLGGAIGFVGYSLGGGTAPMFGGTVYLDFQSLVLKPIVLDGAPGAPGAGTWSLEIRANLANLMGVPLLTQAFVQDPNAPEGWAFTRALYLTVD